MVFDVADSDHVDRGRRDDRQVRADKGGLAAEVQTLIVTGHETSVEKREDEVLRRRRGSSTSGSRRVVIGTRPALACGQPPLWAR